MAFRPPHATYNPGFNLAFGTGLPMASLVGQPTMQMQMGFPGTSPGYHTMGHHANHFYGYGPSFAMAQYPAAPAPAPAANGGSETPDSHSNNEDEARDVAAAVSSNVNSRE